MNLLKITPGKSFIITEVKGNKNLVNKMTAMGICKNKTGLLIMSSKKGPLMIKIGDIKIGIGHNAAKNIIAKEI